MYPRLWKLREFPAENVEDFFLIGIALEGLFHVKRAILVGSVLPYPGIDIAGPQVN